VNLAGHGGENKTIPSRLQWTGTNDTLKSSPVSKGSDEQVSLTPLQIRQFSVLYNNASPSDSLSKYITKPKVPPKKKIKISAVPKLE
jgi:hypothetical protein